MTAAPLPSQRPPVDVLDVVEATSPTFTDDRGHVYAVFGTLWTFAVAGYTAVAEGGWVVATQVWTLGVLVFGFGAVLTHRKPIP